MRIRPLLLVGVTLLIQSCSLLVPSMQLVSITASDPSAEILVDGTLHGRGTVSVELRRSENHTILARVGQRSGVAQIGTSISSTGILDVIGGILFLVPFVGAASPGFYSLNRTSVTLVIPPEEARAPEVDRADLPTPSTTTSTGTGFFVSDSGHLVTNYHVIEECGNLRVVMHDGREYNAVLLRSDRNNDLALLKIESATQPLPLSTATRKADEICVVGYPLPDIQGFEQKTTFGRINSLTGRQGDVRHLQIDCPIQPGNSGGPVINKHGEVVGIATSRLDDMAIFQETGSLPQNVNYAVRSTYLERLLEGIPLAPSLRVGTPDFADVVQSCEQSVAQVMGTCGG